MAVSVAWVADLWRSGAPLLVVGVDLVLGAGPSAPSLLRRLVSRTGLGSLHLLVTGARRCAGALYNSQCDFIFNLIVSKIHNNDNCRKITNFSLFDKSMV